MAHIRSHAANATVSVAPPITATQPSSTAPAFPVMASVIVAFVLCAAFAAFVWSRFRDDSQTGMIVLLAVLAAVGGPFATYSPWAFWLYFATLLILAFWALESGKRSSEKAKTAAATAAASARKEADGRHAELIELYERHNKQLQANLLELLETLRRMEGATPSPSGPEPFDLSLHGPEHKEYLRKAAFHLAKEMREFNDSIPDRLSIEDEHDLVFPVFLKTFWPRLRDIKDRLEVVLRPMGIWVVSSVEWLPTSKDRVRLIAKNLEQEALKIPEDVLL